MSLGWEDLIVNSDYDYNDLVTYMRVTEHRRKSDNKLVQIAAVKATDNLSGVAADSLLVEVTSNEPITQGDIVVEDGVVKVRAERSGSGTGRIYTVASQVSDVAGNASQAVGTCSVPRDRGK